MIETQNHVARASWLLFLFFTKVPQIVIKSQLQFQMVHGKPDTHM